MRPYGFNFQAQLDAMSREWQRQRAKSQMTLGMLIKTLEGIPGEIVIGLGHPHSYRGYYEDIALEEGHGHEGVAASHLLAQCRAAMGRTYCGWKGGAYVMHEHTPVWVAPAVPPLPTTEGTM